MCANLLSQNLNWLLVMTELGSLGLAPKSLPAYHTMGGSCVSHSESTRSTMAVVTGSVPRPSSTPTEATLIRAGSSTSVG